MEGFLIPGFLNEALVIGIAISVFLWVQFSKGLLPNDNRIIILYALGSGFLFTYLAVSCTKPDFMWQYLVIHAMIGTSLSVIGYGLLTRKGLPSQTDIQLQNNPIFKKMKQKQAKIKLESLDEEVKLPKETVPIVK